MAAPDTIKKLVDDFERLKGGPAPDSFDEAQLGTTYVEPFWEALGWAVRDPREVVKEKRVHLRASTRSADYCFQLARKPQFIVEAKDYRKRLDDADFIFQTKRYGYNLPVDFGVLTNFAGFRLFDTGLEPVYENRARGLFKKFDLRYTEYEERWDELAAVFSREAVAAGALRELLPKARRTRNKEALDRKFFERLNEWRAELARNVALRNKDLGVHDINEAVQRILDRAIFMRVIEDRGIEATELLLDALNRWKVEKEKDLYRYVVDKFRYLEPQYNGELFYKHFSEDLMVDDKQLRDFIESLYYPKCPYQFNVVGVEMLGTVYERFLGSEIRLTPSHRAVVEPKPEVRKAGGVYYTPRYIVDYIVENTVGELLKKCKTPAAAAKLKILDPACGSGSFLLGAFRRLIDWHEDYFTANPEKIGKGLAAACWRDADEEKYRLTARFKGQILVNNIFGVDIDDQACEVTRMSLYLKLLEDVDAQFLMKTALLPPLDANVKCGNSLIGSDYFDVGQTFLSVDEDERRCVNPFDWEVEFEEIMKAGGFDAVIGNPPYLNLTVGTCRHDILTYYDKNYGSYRAAQSKNLFGLFIERMLGLLNRSGLFSFIVPEGLARTRSYKKVREIIHSEGSLKNILIFDKFVFEEAYIGSLVFVVTKNDKKETYIVERLNSDFEIDKSFRMDYSYLKASPDLMWNTEPETGGSLLVKRIGGVFPPAENLFNFYKGMVVKDRRNHLRKVPKERDLPFLLGNSLKRYYLEYKDYTSYDELTIVGGTKVLSKHMECPRLLVRRTGDFLCVSYTEDPQLVESTIYIVAGPKRRELLYYLGLFNSRLLTFVVRQRMITNPQAFPQILMTDLKELPFKVINPSVPADVARHDKMVALVEEMLELHKRLAAAKSDADKQRLQRAIAATDRKIDALVYVLYGLTEEEIRVVETGK